MEFGFSLGSNLGDAAGHLRECKHRLLALPDVQFVGQSLLYETEPVGVAPEYAHLKFFNAVLVLESNRAPADWLPELHRIENEMGRIRTEDRNAPRPIDVDLIYAGDQCIDRGDLVVPHPRWAMRRFVVEPLCDVRPDLVMPGVGQTVRAVLAGIGDEAVQRSEQSW
jgi:2-amino-4-hydroxy-6-hydroxymethyldihydropteridine diphosphokinase